MDKNIFIECFCGLKDKRKERTKLHVLLDIVALTLFAIMSGAQTFEEIECFGELHVIWLKQYLSLPNGIPSHDTIRRVLGFLDHQQLIKGFISWITNIKGLIKGVRRPINVINLCGLQFHNSILTNSIPKLIPSICSFH